MSRYPRKQRQELPDFSTLPVVLQAKHVVEIMGCCNSTAMELIRLWDKKKFFPVVWCGNSPRFSRDAFLHYFTAGLITAQKDEEQSEAS